MAKGKSGKSKGAQYESFYPTSVGTNRPDITFQKFPSYSMRSKPTPISKKFSPGPAAYPEVKPTSSKSKKKTFDVPKSIYPDDKAHKYSMRIRGNDFKISPTPGPAGYPFVDANDKKNVIRSIYPPDRANKFSIPKRREEKHATVSPGPARYPRDAESTNINSIHPVDKANKYSMRVKPINKMASKSPGPAVYPNIQDEVKDLNQIKTIYPKDKILPPTFKFRHELKNRDRVPAPNAYPIIEGKHNPKEPLVDVIQKIIPSKKAPQYSFGLKHSNRQQMLILKDDEY